MKTYRLALLLALMITSCGGEQLAAATSLVPSPTETRLPSPTEIPTFIPTLVTTPGLGAELEKALVGADAFLPSGSEPLYNQAWLSNATDQYWGGTYLPYRLEGGVSVQMLGKPRQGCCDWDGKTQVRIWDWRDTGLEPRLWQDVRPVGRGLSSFFGRDADGHWWTVMTQIDWKIPEVALLGIFPVSSLDEKSMETIGMYPTEELSDFQIEPIGLYPEEEKIEGIENFLVREKDHLMLYELKAGQARQIWSTDQTLPGHFHLHSYIDPDGILDMTGDGRAEILVVWDLNDPALIDAYQIGNTESGVLRWLGRFDSTWQYMDVTGDGVAEFLVPDDPEKPSGWNVIRWDGDMFSKDEPLPRPKPISASPTSILREEELPSIPSSIVFPRNGNYEKWWRWSEGGGLPQELPQPPDNLSGDCAPYEFGGYAESCYSPAGRFKLVDVPAQIEGGYTGILDGLTNNTVTIFDSFVYTEGYNTFAWSRDEDFLLFAQGDYLGRLAKVDPVTGESQTVLSSSLCGLDLWHCEHFAVEAVTDPIVFLDGSLGFAFQSAYPSLYPPPGIYRLSPEFALTMLVALPFIDESKGFAPDMPSDPTYGYLLWSPDKSMFLFYDLFVENKSGIRTLLLGKADGSALWDLKEALPTIPRFLWER